MDLYGTIWLLIEKGGLSMKNCLIKKISLSMILIFSLVVIGIHTNTDDPDPMSIVESTQNI